MILALTERRFRLHPHLRHQPAGDGRIEISVPFFGSRRIRAAQRLAALLDDIAAEPPQTGAALARRLGGDVFQVLAKNLYLLPDGQADALAGGLCTPAAWPAGRSLAAHELDTLAEDDLARIFHEHP